jgi:DNA-binding NtrC family response regulator
MTPPRVLIIEDDDSLRQVIQGQLAREGYQTNSAQSGEEALPILGRTLPHLVLTDLNLPGISGIDMLTRIRADYPETAVIVMTAFGTVQTAVQAMKAGAYDFITKPIHSNELKALVKRTMEHQLAETEPADSLDPKFGFEEIIGQSPLLLENLEVAARMAATDATVLIYGETGTGKELIAKAIHLRSRRHDKPFVTINCGSIPRELLESELFGHVKGAFTGAFTHKRGKVEMADGGTLLLDEIGEMPLDLQVRILRLIQEREIEKIGAISPTKVDVRILAATHRNLSVMAKEGTFREDLYYRLLVVPINLPPLRHRKEDIAELVQRFFLKSRIKNCRPDLALPPHILPYFVRYDWPGNIRQLENTVERLVLLTKGAEVTVRDLPDFLVMDAAPTNLVPVELLDAGLDLDAMEKELILHALKKHGGNQTQAARQLNMSRRAFGYRLEKYGLQPEDLKAMKRSAS